MTHTRWFAVLFAALSGCDIDPAQLGREARREIVETGAEAGAAINDAIRRPRSQFDEALALVNAFTKRHCADNPGAEAYVWSTAKEAYHLKCNGAARSSLLRMPVLRQDAGAKCFELRKEKPGELHVEEKMGGHCHLVCDDAWLGIYGGAEIFELTRTGDEFVLGKRIGKWVY